MSALTTTTRRHDEIKEKNSRVFVVPSCRRGLFVFFLSSLMAMPSTAALPKSGRSPVIAKHGIVAASHPLAAQIGLDILKSGGNAIDAAIAADAALGLMEPTSCGIGGDLYALVWDAKSQKLYGLNASGRAPLKTSRQYFADKGLKAIPESGPLSWSVPGCVDGWAELNKRFGKKSLAEILAPSIRYAEEGFPMTEVIGRGWAAGARRLRNDPGSAAVFLPG